MAVEGSADQEYPLKLPADGRGTYELD